MIKNNTIYGGDSTLNYINSTTLIRAHSYGIFIPNTCTSVPKIENNFIDGGTASLISTGTVTNETAGSYGVYCSLDEDPSSYFYIRYNTIDGGSASITSDNEPLAESAGIYFDLWALGRLISTPARIYGNYLDAGSSNSNSSTGTPTANTYSIVFKSRASSDYGYISNSTEIHNNIIIGGNPTTTSLNGTSYGIYEELSAVSGVSSSMFPLINDSLEIRNNTITTGQGKDSYGIKSTVIIAHLNCSISSSNTIQNNLILSTADSGNSYGIFEGRESGTDINAGSSVTTDPSDVRNNDIFNLVTGDSWWIYHDEDDAGDGNISDITVMEALTDITASGNIAVNPVFDAESSDGYYLGTDSPDSVTLGGLNGINVWNSSNDKTLDKDKNLRTPRDASLIGWSMGAYEYPAE